jgi:ribosomal protein S18 acetylase RimI-like enzyme
VPSQAPRDFDLASAADAVEANLFAFFQHLAGWPRVELHADHECCWTLSELPFPLFNSVLRARLSPDRVDEVIGARIAACRSRNVPMLWWTGPSSRPSDLGGRLERSGFFLEPAHGMIADLDAAGADLPIDPGVSVAAVEDAETLAAWSRVLCDSFGAPRPFGDAFADLAAAIGLGPRSPFRHYLASVNGQPVATCSLFFGAGVAGIYNVSTLPERRRRGIGRRVTAAAMQDARSHGYRTAILHSSALGAGMYRALGFIEVCPIGQHVWVPDGFSRV